MVGITPSIFIAPSREALHRPLAALQQVEAQRLDPFLVFV
jgi:hypothetical protein